MEDAYIINGGKKLKGNILISGAKNVALKTIIAALLFKGEVILENVPRINDVTELLKLISALGARASFTDKNKVVVNSADIKKNKVDLLYASKIRVSFMMFAPLLHKFEKCYVPNPGGCRIGARPIDRIIDGMKRLGIEVSYDSETGYYEAGMNEGGVSGEYTFNKPTHTGTELLIMLSVLGQGKVVLNNTALEPEIDELILFLNEAGAKIKRNERQITIEGVSELKQKKPYMIVTDRNEAVTFIAMALATKGDITIDNISYDEIEKFIIPLKETGAGIECIAQNKMRFFYQDKLKPVSVETTPHPGFMTDWQPNWAILMTQAGGDSVIHERVFENRFSYVNELKKLGAKIEFISPEISNPSEFYFFNYKPQKNHQQAIKITGPAGLHNGALVVNDLRAGASLVTAALVAHGESVIQGASIIDRGYEDFEKKLRSLGADIKKF